MRHKAKNYLLFWKEKIKNIKEHIEYDMLLNTYFLPHLISFFFFK